MERRNEEETRKIKAKRIKKWKRETTRRIGGEGTYVRFDPRRTDSF
jgi:hypothetical protein